MWWKNRSLFGRGWTFPRHWKTEWGQGWVRDVFWWSELKVAFWGQSWELCCPKIHWLFSRLFSLLLFGLITKAKEIAWGNTYGGCVSYNLTFFLNVLEKLKKREREKAAFSYTYLPDINLVPGVLVEYLWLMKLPSNCFSPPKNKT